jgi:hypothetical protein
MPDYQSRKYKKFKNSLIAQSAANIATLPIYTIATNITVGTNLNFWRTTKNIYQNYGLLGFYNSTITQFSRQVVLGTIKFGYYFGQDNKTFKNRIINAAFGGFLSTLFTSPFDLYLVKQQTKNYSTGLFRGLTSNLSRGVFASVVQLPCYSYFSADKGYNSFISSLLTTIVTTSIVHPITVYRNNMVADNNLTLKNYKNLLNWRNNSFNSIRLLYRGYITTLLRYIPQFYIFISLFDYLK